jgi:hypothetical protein
MQRGEGFILKIGAVIMKTMSPGARLVFILAGALFYGTVSFQKLTSV